MAEKENNIYYKPVDQQQAQGYLGRYSGLVDSPEMLQAVNRGMARTADLTRQQAYDESLKHKPWSLPSPRLEAATPEKIAYSKQNVQDLLPQKDKLDTYTDKLMLYDAMHVSNTGTNRGPNYTYVLTGNYPHKRIDSNSKFELTDKNGYAGEGRYIPISRDELLPGDAVLYNNGIGQNGHALMFNGVNAEGKDTYNYSNGSYGYTVGETYTPRNGTGFKYYRYVGEGDKDTRDRSIKNEVNKEIGNQLNSSKFAKPQLLNLQNKQATIDISTLPKVTNTETNTRRRR